MVGWRNGWLDKDFTQHMSCMSQDVDRLKGNLILTSRASASSSVAKVRSPHTLYMKVIIT